MHHISRNYSCGTNSTHYPNLRYTEHPNNYVCTRFMFHCILLCLGNDGHFNYRQVSNISSTLVAIKLSITQMWLEHRLSALLQLHLRSQLNSWLQTIGQRRLQDEMRIIWVWGFGASYIRNFTAHSSEYVSGMEEMILQCQWSNPEEN